MVSWGYGVHRAVYSARHHGVPQTRPVLSAVGIRHEAPGGSNDFNKLSPLPEALCLNLREISDPRPLDDDPWKLPTSKVANSCVQAVAIAKSKGITSDWKVAQGWAKVGPPTSPRG